MKLYELTYLISSDLSQEETGKITEQIINLIQTAGGVLGETSNPSIKRLGYAINGKASAFTGSICFRLDQAKLQEFKQKIKTMQNLVRFMLVSKKEKKILTKNTFLRTRPVRKIKETPEKKVELKEIEKKLEEILRE